MRRRVFLAGLAVGALGASSRAAHAQGPGPVVGFLSSGAGADSANLAAASRRGLEQGGFVPGTNLTVEYRWAEGRYERLPELAADLVARKVDVIIAAGGSDPARAAKAATTTLPIVFVTAADPVRTGLVASLSRPEANVTGVSMVGATLEGKRLELLYRLVGGAKPIGALLNPGYPVVKTQEAQLREAASGLGVDLLLAFASTETEIEAHAAAFAAKGVGAVLIANDPFLGSERERLAVLALRHKLPSMSFRREYAVAGGLLSYGADFEDGYRQAGAYAAAILKGANPTELPVLQPTKFELVMNMRTARALGLEVPSFILAQADDVLE